ncbi:LysR substrate-binding domain-containing protein [Variovorax sp. YR216]|uniref:LysR substrate-binding domain-containing protein n=1 Tax=Variovorax sp. YR216 TaxID=1882828 RepID=UPI000896857B|nr:LysR substrate-binding domain-containing protein [Variovorax sp. YR216]SEB23608.1 LysR family transcriptional regulator, cys regulon transcriptional activator [Variovorax sp. YR216]
MNFQQLRAVRETVRCGFSLTEAAHVLQASQSGVSRQIRDLEEELGLELFTRTGKRLVGLTFPGDHLLPFIERLLDSGTDLQRAGQDFLSRRDGMLTIAATHSQARYALPRAVQAFRRIFPEVRLQLHQGSPRQITQMLLDGEVDLGIASELPSDHPQLAVLPCQDWKHVVVVPAGHALLQESPLTIERLASHPLVTYDSGLTGRARIDGAFAAHGLEANIVLTAMDADVIKTYVELGLGVGIIADLAFDPVRDRRLRALDAGHLFGANATLLATRRGGALREFVYAFASIFSPGLDRETLTRSLA